MSDYIKRTDATEAVWRILNGMGYSQKHNDKLVEEVDAVLGEYDADIAPGRDFRDCRNELCLRCGDYRQRHLGACDGCRWESNNG